MTQRDSLPDSPPDSPAAGLSLQIVAAGPAPTNLPRPAVFLDKDGTLVENVPYNVDPARLRFAAGAGPALRRLAAAGYALVVVSNQSGIARGLFDVAAWQRLARVMLERLAAQDVPIDAIYACPHAAPAEAQWPACACRKPSSGMLEAAARGQRLDLERSWMVGDILDDVEAGHRAGCRSILFDSGGETRWRLSPLRRPDFVCSDLSSVADTILACDRSAATGIGHHG